MIAAAAKRIDQEACMHLDLRNTVALIATFGIGLLAGILVGTGLSEFTARGLPESAWVMRFQLEDHLFARAMPPLMLTTLLALIAAFALARKPSRWFLGISIVLMLAVLVVTKSRSTSRFNPGPQAVLHQSGSMYEISGSSVILYEWWPAL